MIEEPHHPIIKSEQKGEEKGEQKDEQKGEEKHQSDLMDADFADFKDNSMSHSMMSNEG